MSIWTLQGTWKTVIPTVIGALGTVTKWWVQGLEDIEMRGRVENPNYGIAKIGHYTEKNPGDLRRLITTQAPVKNHQLMLMWKTLKE